VSCHIGPGATSFVDAKLNGAHQVIAVARNSFARPIAPPLDRLRPAIEICEQCHARSQLGGDRLVVHTRFAEDEANTRSTTVLTMKLGVIHGRHLDARRPITFVPADATRGTITRVSTRASDGKRVEYRNSDVTSAASAQSPARTMDCLDCHNRPSHSFEDAADAVDRAMAAGRIPSSLPWVRKEALALLVKDYPEGRGEQAIGEALGAFYRSGQMQGATAPAGAVSAAGRELASIYARNVFPAMKVRWGTYVRHNGHQAFPGCLRCHSGSMVTAAGAEITSDCEACHTVVANEEVNPKILTDLGLAAGR
jgi:hypothetical protein